MNVYFTRHNSVIDMNNGQTIESDFGKDIYLTLIQKTNLFYIIKN